VVVQSTLPGMVKGEGGSVDFSYEFGQMYKVEKKFLNFCCK